MWQRQQRRQGQRSWWWWRRPRLWLRQLQRRRAVQIRLMRRTENDMSESAPLGNGDEQNAEAARKIRNEIAQTLNKLARQMDDAKTAGFVVSFNIEPDRTGKYYTSSLIVAKHY